MPNVDRKRFGDGGSPFVNKKPIQPVSERRKSKKVDTSISNNKLSLSSIVDPTKSVEITNVKNILSREKSRVNIGQSMVNSRVSRFNSDNDRVILVAGMRTDRNLAKIPPRSKKTYFKAV